MTFLVVFTTIVIGSASLALRRRNRHLAALIDTTLTTTAEFAVRLVMLFLAVMLLVTYHLHLDVLLGAFAAGMVFRLFGLGASEREAEIVESKLFGLAFGFLVPVFFVVSGVQFDLDGILREPALLLTVPGILLLFLVVRGGPTALLHRESSGRDRLAIAFYVGTQLPLVIIVTSIGVENGDMTTGAAAALVTAALVSVLVFPIAAARIRPLPDRAPARPRARRRAGRRGRGRGRRPGLTRGAGAVAHDRPVGAPPLLEGGEAVAAGLGRVAHDQLLLVGPVDVGAAGAGQRVRLAHRRAGVALEVPGLR